MPPIPCERCHTERAVIRRPKNLQRLCRTCFIHVFELEIHNTITNYALFTRGERVAIGASGGKDSTVLASVMKTLNERYDYGLDLILLSIDEGITGYRDDSLETVKRNAVQYGMPLEILGYKELYGWTMDEVVKQVGKKGNCTYCGVFRRQALDRGAAKLGVKHVVTGHNADDVAETVLMNLLRGDLPRLARATSIMTASASSPIKRSKPLKYAYEKEIVLYAHHKKLDYFSTECIYSPEAFRGSARALIKNLERIRPSAILDVVRSGEDMARLVPETVRGESGGDSANKRGGRAHTGGAGKTVKEQEDDVNEGGCGSANGRGSGGEMADMEKKLREDERAEAEGMEVEITNVQSPRRPEEEVIVSKVPPTISTEPSPDSAQTRLQPTTTSAQDKNVRKVQRQQLGKCQRCGYISSQAICKACMLLEGLNRNKPKTGIEIGEDEDGSRMRQMENMAITEVQGSKG